MASACTRVHDFESFIQVLGFQTLGCRRNPNAHSRLLFVLTTAGRTQEYGAAEVVVAVCLRLQIPDINKPS
jgi:hypothetical protein